MKTSCSPSVSLIWRRNCGRAVHSQKKNIKQSVVTAPTGVNLREQPMEMAIRFLSELRDRTQDTDVVQGLDKALTLLQAFGGARSITPIERAPPTLPAEGRRGFAMARGCPTRAAPWHARWQHQRR